MEDSYITFHPFVVGPETFVRVNSQEIGQTYNKSKYKDRDGYYRVARPVFLVYDGERYP